MHCTLCSLTPPLQMEDLTTLQDRLATLQERSAHRRPHNQRARADLASKHASFDELPTYVDHTAAISALDTQIRDTQEQVCVCVCVCVCAVLQASGWLALPSPQEAWLLGWRLTPAAGALWSSRRRGGASRFCGKRARPSQQRSSVKP